MTSESDRVADAALESEQATDVPTKQERVPAAVRREQILEAASHVFGERGYVGATTDQVARAAGISQPYVVRMFGSKENLFAAVLDRALDKLMEAFHGALAETDDIDDRTVVTTRLGAAYADLISDRGILLSLMQGFISGHDAVIGAKARSGFLAIYQLLRDEAGMEPDEIVDFLAHGMLFNTLIAMHMVDEFGSDDPCIRELLTHTFRTKLDIVVNTVTGISASEAHAAAMASHARATA
ncbi:TetR/AcrR family transcriptional regulator [Planctomonas sp. JC2975]|uniref:TetR/AcrR family transcriptional regulator n=1 Tax=Planctomonas sp. JC2975 TaxID=2729626 RepID=UPI0014749AFA|nr:TetR/AcrR family transcriptional regulator [Planctomonas sp. JC2975]NNC13274.1 TetR/AcrR family transcriptional regulator [Planctomonas sp. JC2975]